MYSYYPLIVFCLCNFVTTAVIPSENGERILSYDYKNFGRGNYEFSFVTSNGITRNETGQLLNAGQDNEHIAVVGTYSYIDPEGKTRLFQYTADENGYQVHFHVEESHHFRPREKIEVHSAVSYALASPLVASLLGG